MREEGFITTITLTITITTIEFNGLRGLRGKESFLVKGYRFYGASEFRIYGFLTLTLMLTENKIKVIGYRLLVIDDSQYA